MKKLLLRHYLRLRYGFVRDKQRRRQLQESFRAALNERRFRKQKWGVSYSVFDGEELLEASLRCIRPCVDYINVVWQQVSWYGAPVHEDLYPLLLRLKKEGLIDEIIEYKVNLKLKSIKNETRKRNDGMKAARKAGCTYFMSMDTDEFYKAAEVEEAKRYIVEKDITHSYCSQVIYGEQPTRIFDIPMCCCQFFSRLTPWSCHRNDPHSTALVDPSRKMSHIPWYLGGSRHYFLHLVKMNHFSLIRKDLNRKYDNSSSADAREGGEYKLQLREWITCPDYFGLEEVMRHFHD